MFVDTRLHIAVRPALEYQLPEAAVVVKACLLGDARREDALAALQSLLRDTCTRRTATSRPIAVDVRPRVHTRAGSNRPAA